jgi:hypothetical protein
MYNLLQTEFGLVIGFIDHLQIVTTANSDTLQFSTAHIKSFQSAVSCQSLSGIVLQQRMFPLLWVFELSPFLN